jgi:undecaprenyl diphosphate synthase
MENLQRLPVHVAVIMDGNGRWAEKRGLPRLLGHRAGIAALERALRAAGEMGIRYFSVYAFSTENWNRPESEVSGLMDLLQYYARKKVPELAESGVRVRFCGSRENVPESVLKIMDWCMHETASCSRMTFIVCFNYGGRQEIIDAVKKARKTGTEIRDEKDLQKFLYLPDVPDPDLIIRTSGELRLSNFWLWESSYSEYYFTDVLWPDFAEEDLKKAVESYAGRKRRYGRI